MTFPQWVTKLIAEWKPRLYLHEWTIETSISVDFDAGTQAQVTLWPNIWHARIEFRDTIPDKLTGISKYEKERWTKVIIHELLHIRMARITEGTVEIMYNQMSMPVRLVMTDAFLNDVVPVVEILTAILYDMAYGEEL